MFQWCEKSRFPFYGSDYLCVAMFKVHIGQGLVSNKWFARFLSRIWQCCRTRFCRKCRDYAPFGVGFYSEFWQKFWVKIWRVEPLLGPSGDTFLVPERSQQTMFNQCLRCDPHQSRIFSKHCLQGGLGFKKLLHCSPWGGGLTRWENFIWLNWPLTWPPSVCASRLS